jgi:hypothetical protein
MVFPHYGQMLKKRYVTEKVTEVFVFLFFVSVGFNVAPTQYRSYGKLFKFTMGG